MKLNHLLLVTSLSAITTTPALADDGILTGDTRTACEAILCLATGSQPSECTPPLKKYFSIRAKKWKDTLKARTDFLKLCPASNQDQNMSSLVESIANGAGRCDAAALNAQQMISTGGDNMLFAVKNTMPAHCTAYLNNAYTDLAKTAPKYVGTPETQGFWVEASKYDQAVLDYNARMALQQQQNVNY